MTTSTTENEESTQATATEKPEAPKKAQVGARKPHVTPSKAKSGKNATPAKKGAKAAKVGKTAKKASGTRQGSKTEKVVDLLKRSGGASLKDIMKTTDWKAHSTRGFISGILRKKMGFKVESTKTEDGERVYSLAK